MSTMLMCSFTSNELIGPFLDTYRGLALVYSVSDFGQFHEPLYKSRQTFRDQFWVLENRHICHKIQYITLTSAINKASVIVLMLIHMLPTLIGQHD